MRERSPRISLTVIDGGIRKDLSITASASASAGEVVDALARHVGERSDAQRAVLHRTGEPVQRSARWASALAHGDVIDLDRSGDTGVETPDEGVDLVIVGGPDAGRRIALRAGTQVLGRAGHADVGLDDVSVSREHARLEVDGTTVRVIDLRSRNGSFIEGRAITAAEVLQPGQVLEIGSTLLSVDAGSAGGATSRADRVVDGRIPFNRPPRLQAPHLPAVISIPAPPGEPTSRRFPIGTALLPLLMGVALFAATRQPASLLFALLSPTMAVYSAIDDRRSGRRTFRSDTEVFRRRVEDAAEAAAQARRREVTALRSTYPDLADLVTRCVDRDERLWERRPEDIDHLDVRIGAADQSSAVSVEVARGGSEALRAEATDVIEASSTLASVPVVVGLAREAPLGIVGPRAVTAPLARALVVQLAALHAPSDVAIAVATSESHEADWAWATWLPHADRERGGLPFPLVATSPDDLQALAAGVAAGTATSPVVALVVDDAGADPGRWATALEVDAAGGCVVVWLAEQRRDLPNRCRTVLECGAGSARLTRSNGSQVGDIVVDGAAIDVAERVSRALAPVVAVTGRGGGAVPARVGLLETLQMDGDLAEQVEARWRAATPGANAPIGRDGDGVHAVDLDRDGPHAVVAGTPGAGKSELLQSWLASMAASHPPERVTFLVIDFKGAATARLLGGLPHVVGVVTDLTPQLADRALTSLGAELERRERILDEGGAKSLAQLVQERPDLAPPKLVIVIDEFAALKQDLPRVMDELIDLAQRGRSLGMHLVLATQDPSVVDQAILRNVNLRICLRVVDPEVSRRLVDVPDAALLRSDQVGRALVRSGGGAVRSVQVAYGGGRATRDDGSSDGITVSDHRRDAPVPDEFSVSEQETELAQLVAAIRRVSDETGWTAPSAPWLPPLPAVLPLAEVPAADGPGRAAIGMVDLPASQRQDPLVVDLVAHGAVAVFGTARSGKSTALRTIAASLTMQLAPDELNLYGLDFGSGALAALESLPHCGAVVSGADDERVRRLLRQLSGVVDARRRAFSETGASNLDDLRTRTGAPQPRLVLLLDEYGGLTAAYERVDLGEVLGMVARLVADGPGVGVHVILTADRRGALPMAVHSAITQRIVLPLATADEHAALGVDARLARDRSPGRAIVEDAREAQIAILGEHGDAATQVAALHALGSELAARYPGQAAPGIATLPSHVSGADLPSSTSPLGATVGVGDASLEAVQVDLAEGHLLVVGPHRSGRTTSLATLAVQLSSASSEPELVLLSPRRTALDQLVAFSRVAVGDACQELASTLAAEVELRRDDGSDRPLVVLVDDVDELFDSPASASLERLARRGRDRAVRIVAACESKGARTFSGVVPELRKSRRALLLMPNLDLDGDLVDVRLPRRATIAFVPGRGFLAHHGQVELVQVASPPGWD